MKDKLCPNSKHSEEDCKKEKLLETKILDTA